jgi:prevent-host-death family protein
MDTIENRSVSEARRRLSMIIGRVTSSHESIILTRRGRRVAAVIDADDRDAIMAFAEDMAGILAAEEARGEMRRTGEIPVPWDEVRSELGLG